MGNPRILYAYRVLLYKGDVVVKKRLAQTSFLAEGIRRGWMAECADDDDHRVVIIRLDTLAPSNRRRRGGSLRVGDEASR